MQIPLASADSHSVPALAPRRFYRHRLPVRVMHSINVVCLVVR